MNITKNLSYDPNFDCCKLDLYLPEEVSGKLPLYVFIHGGGLEEGDKSGDRFEKMARYLTDQGIAMASVNYRMYPHARYPDYIRDVANAVAWLDRTGAYSDLAIGGQSAGGYITQMLYFNKAFLSAAGVEANRVKAFIMDAGQPTAHFNVLRYERGMDSRAVVIDETAALYYLREAYTQPEKEPYVAIFAANRDMINRMEQNKVLETAMLHFGFPREKLLFRVFEDFCHCGYCGEDFYMETVTDFLKKAFGL